MCKRCGNLNYPSRLYCNIRKCGARRDGSGSVENWICRLCGNENYPSRTVCNRRTCGTPREEAELTDPSSKSLLTYSITSPPPPSILLSTQKFPHFLKGSKVPPSAYVSFYSFPIYTLDPNTDKKRRFSDTNTETFIIDQTAKKFRANAGAHPSPYPYSGFPTSLTYPFYSPLSHPLTDRKSQPMHEEDINWICLKCGNDNFARRKVCNMKKCGAPRPEETKLWKCRECGNFNYPSRTKCNMKKCQSPRPLPSFYNTFGRDSQETMETDQDYESQEAKEGLQEEIGPVSM